MRQIRLFKPCHIAGQTHAPGAELIVDDLLADHLAISQVAEIIDYQPDTPAPEKKPRKTKKEAT